MTTSNGVCGALMFITLLLKITAVGQCLWWTLISSDSSLLWEPLLFLPHGESRSATRSKLTCRAKQCHACSAHGLHPFQPFDMSVFRLGLIFLAPNPSSKFLFGPMLVPCGCLSLKMKKAMNSQTTCEEVTTREPRQPPRRDSKHRRMGTHAF